LIVSSNDGSYTLVDESGHILCSGGTGGNYIIAKDVEQITVLDGVGNPICQPVLPVPPETPKATLFSHLVISGTEGDDNQITFGNPVRDFILQYGQGGNDTQYITGSDNDDWLEQDGGDGNDNMSITGGYGNDVLHQDGGNGNDNLIVDAGDGLDWITQIGGSGDDDIVARGGDDNDHIDQSGGSGNDTMRVDLGAGDDFLRIDGGAGNATITYSCSSGQDTVVIGGGPGRDRLTINQGDLSFTLVEESGRVLFSVGSGGTYLIVKELEHITVLDYRGKVRYTLNRAATVPILAPMLLRD
jgi:Ca2+-binding RTX toxin-like protein